MKQILQDLKNGITEVAEVPAPKVLPGTLIIKTKASIISAGTERMLVDFGKANLLAKARQQPEKVRMVFEKIQTDGLLPTLEAVQAKLDNPLPLGYCNAGVVLEPSDSGFHKGQRVVSNGYHAEFVRCPKNLCAPIPDNVDDESAAFTVLGAIALQGVRLAKPTIGESIVVIGLGLVGLLTLQILRANGCKVLAVDFDSARCELAKSFGAQVCDLSKGYDSVEAALLLSNSSGVDAVIIAASSKNSEIISNAAKMCRKKGRIVLVGVVGLELSREQFFKKELSFQVSCSYGPGRYDPLYEISGQDYPLGYVRWTENRNFLAVLDLMASGLIDVKPLISHRYSIENGALAYSELDNKAALGICLNYDSHIESDQVEFRNIKIADRELPEGSASICSFIGAGNYASRTLIPAFKAANAVCDSLVSSGGVSSTVVGKKFGFPVISTDIEASLKDDHVNTIVISTTHNLHAGQVVAGLVNKKHIFVEKPLAITLAEVDQIETAYNSEANNNIVMVGFNRRFSPHIVKMKDLLKSSNTPKNIVMTINAGAVPSDHWLQDKEVGGGRVIGEVCHFIDLMRFLVGKKVTQYSATMIGESRLVEVRDDKVVIVLSFADGSVGVINYLANGGKAFPKERIEVFSNDAVLQLNNFRELRGFGWKGFNKFKTMRQNKGQKECVAAFVNSVTSGSMAPIPMQEILEVSRLTIKIAESLRNL
jgi:predicted dehydrogenase